MSSLSCVPALPFDCGTSGFGSSQVVLPTNSADLKVVRPPKWGALTLWQMIDNMKRAVGDEDAEVAIAKEVVAAVKASGDIDGAFESVAVTGSASVAGGSSWSAGAVGAGSATGVDHSGSGTSTASTDAPTTAAAVANAIVADAVGRSATAPGSAATGAGSAPVLASAVPATATVQYDGTAASRRQRRAEKEEAAADLAEICRVLVSVPQLEKTIDAKRRGVWRQWLGATRAERLEIRTEHLVEHTTAPECGCYLCPGFAPRPKQVIDSDRFGTAR